MRLFPIVVSLLAAVSAPAVAALPVGAMAPDFTADGALGGKPFALHLKEQLRHGPVVLYFFPKAFTDGCTFEAKAFSDASADFRKAGARVIGMSGDPVPLLQKFSTEACRSKFPVASATPAVIQSYDVAIPGNPAMSGRTSYVIDRSGKITLVYSNRDYKDHVAQTLAAVRALKQ